MSEMEKVRAQLADGVAYYSMLMSDFLDSMDDTQEEKFRRLQELQGEIRDIQRTIAWMEKIHADAWEAAARDIDGDGAIIRVGDADVDVACGSDNYVCAHVRH